MTETIQRITAMLVGSKSFSWMVFAMAAMVALKLLLKLVKRRCRLDIKGRVLQVRRGGLVQIDVGESDRVARGQVFVVYKKLALREARHTDAGPTRTMYTPVGRMKVVSTTRSTSLCKFRPLEGYSYSPGRGDLVVYSSSHATGGAPGTVPHALSA